MVIVNAVLLVLIVGLIDAWFDPERRVVLRWIPIPFLRGVRRMVTLLVLGVIGAGLVGVVQH